MKIVPILLAGAVAVGALAACAQPTFNSVDEAAYAGALCVDGRGYRVPDDYCPIGDEPVTNYAFHWAYRPYRADQSTIDVVYVGYPVDTRVWVSTLPPNVGSLHIDRGQFPLNPPPGVSSGAVRVESNAHRQQAAGLTSSGTSSSTARGGLGTTRGSSTVSSATPLPGATVKRGTIAPPPAGARPMAVAKAKAKAGK